MKGEMQSLYYKAIRLVALSQASSTAVERVFSQLTFIRRAVGDSTTRHKSKSMLELRAMLYRFNKGLVGIYEAKTSSN